MPAEARNAGHAFATVVVDELARHGVTDAVIAPGSRSTPVALALLADARLVVHVRIDERSASYLALGLARASRRPVPVVCTSGTATAHLHAAAMEADTDRVPLLLLTADRPPELRGVGANQTVDQLGLYGAAARWSVDVGVPEARADSVRYWRSLVSRAVAVATGASGGPAGPVHLNLPLREPLVPADDGVGFPFALDGRPDGAPWTQPGRAAAPLDPAWAGRIADAERGVVVAGGGLDDADTDGLLAFAAARDWPVLAEPHSNARCGPHALPAVDAVLRDDRFSAGHRPDLVVVAGRAGLSRALLGWLATVPHVLVDRDGAWADPTRTALAVLRSDPASLARLGAGDRAPAGWADAWRSAAGAAADAVDALLDEQSVPTEPGVARALARGLPDGGALVVGSSMPVRDLDLTLRSRHGLRVFANRGVSGIDGFVSTAAGIASVRRRVGAGPTVALCGDLTLLHDVNGLQADPPVALTLVVLNNDGGGIFSLLPQAQAVAPAAFERAFGTPHGVDLARLVTAYGATHVLAADMSRLHDELGHEPSGIHVVEVRTDRAANADLHAGLAAAAARAVASVSSREP